MSVFQMRQIMADLEEKFQLAMQEQNIQDINSDSEEECLCDCENCSDNNCSECLCCDDCKVCDLCNEYEEFDLIDEEYKNNVQQTICPHYDNNISFVAPCCKKEYKCIKCHDDNEDHKVDKNKIKKIICFFCDTSQKIKNSCINKTCSMSFGRYICYKCFIFTNSNKYVHHCDLCNKCIEYKSLHCKYCNHCYPELMDHNCLKLDNCPICLNKIKKKDLFTLSCGHITHKECYNFISKNTHKCPICNKTINDMTKEYLYLDKEILKNKVPKELKEKVNIQCNDCRKESNVDFHYIGLKCKNCSSYNTYQI
jgi:hypothetical protein